MATAELLVNKYLVPEPIAAEIGDLADAHRRNFSSYPELLEGLGVREMQTVSYDGYKPLQVVDIKPRQDYNEKKALLVHVAMANSLDPNQLVQIGIIAAANPDTRVIAHGNPAAPRQAKSGLLTWPQMAQVARGDFAPTVDPFLKFLEEQGIEEEDHYGYSYGEVALTEMMKRAERSTHCAISFDTARAVQWAKHFVLAGGVRLGFAFNATAAPMQGYVEESELPAFEAARDDSPGALAYALGVARASNIAIGLGISHGGYVEETRQALLTQPEARYTGAYGTQSEFNTNGETKTAMTQLETEFGERFTPRPVATHHAGANNIYLQAALVREARTAA